MATAAERLAGGYSHFHHGPRQAGNKSLLSYRAGFGISGYIGFTPSMESIPYPSKGGPNERAGPNADQRRALPQWKLLEPLHPESVYQNTYDKIATATYKHTPDSAIVNACEPNDITKTIARSKKDDFGGDSANMPRNAAFIATSSNKAEYTAGKGSNILPHTHVSRPRSVFITPTTYSDTIEKSVDIRFGPQWIEKKLPRPDIMYGRKWKEVIVQPEDRPTMYHTDYGDFGDGIMAELPNHHLGISDKGTTKHLFKGTAKAFKRMPGYVGFVPSSSRNPHAVAQATNDHDRKDSKDFRLFTLRQYLLEIPGTAIFQPQDASNLMADPKGRAGTATSYNNAILSNPDKLAEIARQRATQAQHGCTQATRTFFQGGNESISENGIKNAESFFKLVRPLEGLPRVFRPSETADSGYLFSCYTGKVG